jgi:hypothetical protein
MKKQNILLLLVIIVGITLIYLFIFYSSKRTVCPYNSEGNPNANLTIKYIDSPYCFWCWLQEPVLKELVETKGNSFLLEKYDIRYCNEIVNKFEFSGTPSFVFSFNETHKYAHYGYINKDEFYNIICKTTGNC